MYTPWSKFCKGKNNKYKNIYLLFLGRHKDEKLWEEKWGVAITWFMVVGASVFGIDNMGDESVIDSMVI